MRILYNPLSAGKLTTTPADNNITFDLPALKIYAKGIAFDCTDKSVFQENINTEKFRPVVLGVSDWTNSENTPDTLSSVTDKVLVTSKIYAQPSTGLLYASKLYSDGKEVLTQLKYLKADGTTVLLTGSDDIDLTSGIYFSKHADETRFLNWRNKPNIATIGATTWRNGVEDGKLVWGQYWQDPTLGSSTGVLSLWLNGFGSPTDGKYPDINLNMTLDGLVTAYGFKTLNGTGNNVLLDNGTTKPISEFSLAGIPDLPSSKITSLTGYDTTLNAPAQLALSTTDSLNLALNKLEYRTKSLEDWLAVTNPTDTTIDRLQEVFNVLAGINDTDTINSLLGKYLPLTGGTLKNTNTTPNTPLFIDGDTVAYVGYSVTNKSSILGYIGYNSSNSACVVDRDGQTAHNIITHDTVQTISGTKTFNSIIYAPDAEKITIGTILATNTTDNTVRKVNIADLASNLHDSEIITFTKTLTLTVESLGENIWIDTGISGGYLTSGTYIILLYSDGRESNELYVMRYSGVMSWYSGSTNGSPKYDEIILHACGHDYSVSRLYLRTMHENGNGIAKLQISANKNLASSEYIFKFRKII